jgi:ABC-2 type transport system ATP-binding protein
MGVMPPLQFISASKRWNGATALNGMDLIVAPGEVVALLGRSHAGKSTAIGLALGLFKPDAGSVRLFGQAPGGIAVRRRIGALVQHADLPGTARVHELIRLVRAYYPAPMSVEQAAAAAGLTHLLGYEIRRMSAAQRRAVQMALAICGRPQVLILDDPASAMESSGRERLWSSVREMVRNGCAVLTTAHCSDDLEGVADRVCVLSGGTKVAETTVSALRAMHVVRRVVCRTATALHTLRNLPEALVIRTDADGRLSIETGTPELLVQRLFSLDPNLTDLQVLHASSPQIVRIG